MTISPETVTYQGSGLVFKNSYGSNVSVTFRNEIVAAENYLQSQFGNTCTVSCSFDLQSLSPSFSGENSFSPIIVSYSSFVNALRQHATTATSQAAAASLANLSDPSHGAGFEISVGEARILGLAGAGTGTDDAVVLNSYYWTASALQNYPGDAEAVIEHEVTEGVMGRIGELGLTGSPYWAPMDLFRYNSSGQRDFTGGRDGQATYFSVDGSTVYTGLQYHNSVNTSGGYDGYDFADWDGVGADSNFHDPFGPGGPGSGDPGTLSATDLLVLQALGWAPPASATADLTATGLTLTAASATVTINNNGTGSASASTTKLYLSPDANIDPSDSLVGTYSTPILGPGAAVSETISFSLPTNLSPGTYCIGAVADATNQVAETNESNNVTSLIPIIIGNSSSNTLVGTSGADTIYGLGGADTLVGGAGADKFVFGTEAQASAEAASSFISHITDYDHGATTTYNGNEGDQVDLSSILSAPYGRGAAVSSLVRVIEASGADSAWLQINPHGAEGGWETIGQLDGLHVGDGVNVVLSNSQPAGSTVTVQQTVLTDSDTAPFGDFNGDGHADFLWESVGGSTSMWQMAGNGIQAITDLQRVPADWHITATGDFNGDGRADLLWRNLNGTASMWEMNGSQIQAITDFNGISNAWHVVGAADFNGDGKSDILWRNDNGTPSLWQMNGLGVQSVTNLPQVPTTWHVVAEGDFNGDGKADILWRNDSGALSLWQMQGGQIQSINDFSIPSDWHVVGTGDFNGDHKQDIVWRNDNGEASIWLMNGAHPQSISNFGVGTEWHFSGTGDFNGDGHADIAWRNDNGATSVWQMNGPQIQAVTDYPNVGTNWHLDAPKLAFV